MALTKVTGHVVKPDTNIQFHNTKSTGIVTFAHTDNATSSTTGALQITGGVGIVKDLHVGGNVTVGGTLTYDDVTNIDSIGIITSRTGIKVLAGGLNIVGVSTFHNNIIATATTALSVTAADESSDTTCNVLFATAATGNVAPKTGTNLTFNSNTGALTATSFVGALTGTASGNAIINSNADNRVITGGSGVNLNGESSFTYDAGSLIVSNGSGNVTQQLNATSGDAKIVLDNSGDANYSGIDFERERSSGAGVNGGSIFMKSDTSSNNAYLYLQAQSASAQAPVTTALSDDNGVRLILKGGSGIFSVETGDGEKFRVQSDGKSIVSGPNNVAQTPVAILDVFNQGTTTQALRVYRNDLNDNTLAAFQSYHNTMGIVDKMVITSRGKVGINTNNPERELHVKPWDNNPATAAPGYIRIEGNGANQAGILEFYHTRANGSDKWPSSIESADAGLTFRIATAVNGTPQPVFRITHQKEVGIGTDNPQYQFDLFNVAPASSGTSPILAIRNGYQGTANQGNELKSEIRFQHRNHNSAHEFMATRIISDTVDNYNQRTFLRFLVAKGNNGTERLTISPEGRVGINSLSPTHTLAVQEDTDNNPSISLFRPSTGGDVANIIWRTNAGGQAMINYRGATPAGLQFYTGGTSSSNLNMIIATDGDVGIGTDAIHNNARLQVSTHQQVVAQFEGTGVSDPQIYVGDDMSSPTDNCIILGYDKADNRGYLTVGGDGDNVFTVKDGGDVEIGVGNLKFGTSGKGIDFSATGGSSGVANHLLDDYEEGSWTPGFYPLSSAMTQTYDLRTGSYVKIGRVVYWQFRVRLSGLSGQMGQTMGFGGFPFNVDASQPQFSANFYGSGYNGEVPTGIFYDGNVNRGTLYYHKNDAQNVLYASDLNPTNSYTVGSGFYFAA